MSEESYFENRKAGLNLGEIGYRKRTTGDRVEWIEFIVNETYIPLIAEFPEDYHWCCPICNIDIDPNEKYSCSETYNCLNTSPAQELALKN